MKRPDKTETKNENKASEPDAVFDKTSSDDDNESDGKIKRTTSSKPTKVNTEVKCKSNPQNGRNPLNRKH
jgi:hypothetical protein